MLPDERPICARGESTLVALSLLNLLIHWIFNRSFPRLPWVAFNPAQPALSNHRSFIPPVTRIVSFPFPLLVGKSMPIRSDRCLIRLANLSETLFNAPQIAQPSHRLPARRKSQRFLAIFRKYFWENALASYAASLKRCN